MHNEQNNDSDLPVDTEVSALPPQAVSDETATQSLAAAPLTDASTEDSAAASDEDVMTAAVSTVGRFGVNDKAELTKAVKTALNGPVPDIDNSLAIFGVDIDEFNELAENYPNDIVDRSERGRHWAGTVAAAQRHIMRGNALLKSLTREDSYWRQSVKSGAEELQAGRPRFEDSEGSRLTGVQAMAKLQAVLGMGAIVRVPLWHSGMYLSMKAPTEAALLELNRRIASEKVTLGRMTNGMVFGSSSVYINRFLVDFILAHVYEASYKYTDAEELKEVILLNDLPTMIWGLLCTIYPQGYSYKQPCVTDPTKCNHVIEELLSLSKLSWTDNRAFSEYQLKHMQRKLSKFTDDELKRYREEHRFNRHAVLELHPQVAMHLKVPTLAEYETSGTDWVDGIVQQVDQAFGGQISAEERNKYIYERGQMTALRMYAHYIEKVVIGGTQTIEDVESISDTIATLTAQDDLYTTFINGVGSFIDNTTISLIAIPKFNCPACGKPQSAEEAKHPHLITLDVAQIFFTLQRQRIRRVLSKVAL